MQMSFKLGVSLVAHVLVARAAPQRGGQTFPISNSTRPAPTSVTATCANKCSVQYPQITGIQWIPESQIVYTSKITVGTISLIYTTSGNSTWGPSTQTVYGYVPPEYDLYRLGALDDGTALVTVPISTDSDGFTLWSDLIYPTPYIDYVSEYKWGGVVQTTKESNTVCATATDEAETRTLPSHVNYPQPTQELSPGRADPSGIESRPLWVPFKDEPDKAFFDRAFPSESAFALCESQAANPAPTTYEAPFFVTVYETVFVEVQTSAAIVIVQPTATGWEQTSSRKNTPGLVHAESTQTGFETTPPFKGSGGGDHVITSTVPAVHVESSAHDFGTSPVIPTQGPQTGGGAGGGQSVDIVSVIVSIINNNPGVFAPGQSNPITTNPGFAAGPSPTPTATYTLVPNVVNGQTSYSPAFILPGSGATATIGQTATINGQPTVLAAPPAYYTNLPATNSNGAVTSAPVYFISGTSTATLGQTVTLNGQTTVLAPPAPYYTIISTNINGSPTTIPAYIFSGTSTATIGQTITINGTPTVLSAPSPVFTVITTTINGVSTTIPAYIISGTITATIGQTVTINGTPTVLSAPTEYVSWISTTINGKPTSVPVYIINGSTATIGQTVVVNGKTTVLSYPTATSAAADLTPSSINSWPVATTYGAQATDIAPVKGDAGGGRRIGWNALLLVTGAIFLVIL